ncbi:MAG: hydantoinase/oxoprolinase family protein [Planctomycetota bacterium]
MPCRIGIDTGGTFTDVVRRSRRDLEVFKIPSTPGCPSRAVVEGLALARRGPGEAVDLVHGTTVGLNAILTGNTARTAFLTNEGFVDLIEIGRQDRLDLYALKPGRPEVPVPRELRIGVACRRGPGGAVVTRLSGPEVDRAVRRLARLKPEAVAIGLLHSPADPADEHRLAQAVRRALPGIPVTCSADLYPGYGEFERFCAAILNAAIQPRVSSYLDRLEADMGPGSLRLMRSSTGILAAEEARRFPARAMFSGPAGGVLATRALAGRLRRPAAVAFDMGGTSTDVCLVRKSGDLTDEARVRGLPLPLPAAPVHTVGCGGGSIAFVDRGGMLRVGPASAGADPGPACYGRSDDATVTDAHVALGHLGAGTLLGGAFPIDPGASVRAIERLGRRLGMTVERTARGILEIAEVHMARALLVVTAEQAVDPSRLPLISYGGAGGLAAARLADRLSMPCALVPAHPGAFSAIGLALAGASIEIQEPLDGLLDKKRERDLSRRAAAAVRAHGSLGRPSLSVLLRFAGQGRGLWVPWTGKELAAAFCRAHRARFGFAPEECAIECVGWTLRVEEPPAPLPAARIEARGRPRPRFRKPPAGGSRHAFYGRSELAEGATLEGPCTVEEFTGATLVPAGFQLRITPHAMRIEPQVPRGSR